MTALRPATVQDLPAILALLGEAALPHRDLTAAHVADFIVAAGEHSVLGMAGLAGMVGMVGLERYGENALLRSLAVRPESRLTGLGTQLADAIEEHARRTGVETLYLLTMTAADFFRRRGYEVIDRATAPSTLLQTTEFSSLCPAQATCMRRRLIQKS